MASFIFDLDNRNKGYIQSDYLDNIREHFSVPDPAAAIMQKKYGNKRFIPKRKYGITPAGRFGVGMFAEIYKYIDSLQVPVRVVVTDKFKERFKPSYTFSEKDLNELNLPLRDYQIKAIIKCLKQGNGIIEVGTGGGKTLIMSTLVNTIRKNTSKHHKTLIITPGIQLVEQTYNDFLEYGIDKSLMSKWSGDNELDESSKIIIAGLSILQSKKQDLSVLNEFDLLIFDEVHKLRKDNKINKVLDKIDVVNKFGFTGTLPEDKVDQWNIIGKIGPILYKKTSYELREENYLTQAKIKILKLFYKGCPEYLVGEEKFNNPTLGYNNEGDFIFESVFRNEIISKIANKVDGNALIIVDRIKHGELLEEELKKVIKDKKIYFIQGSVKVKAREEMRKLMEENNDIICIAIAKIFSTGINIKNLSYIILGMGGKAKIKIIQTIGRGLRKHENKKLLIIFDIADMLFYGMKHLAKRELLYIKEKIQYEYKEIRES